MLPAHVRPSGLPAQTSRTAPSPDRSLPTPGAQSPRTGEILPAARTSVSQSPRSSSLNLSLFPLRLSLLCELCAVCDLRVIFSFLFSFNFQLLTLNSRPFASSHNSSIFHRGTSARVLPCS